MLIRSEASCLFVVDIQERLLPAMHEGDRVLKNTVILMRAAERLGVPILVSEQYPRGLGASVPQVGERAPAGATFEKSEFSCLANAGLRNRFRDLRRFHVVVVGIEAHVCVLQTVMDLRQEGCEAFVVADGVSSRTATNAQLGLDRMTRGGAHVVSAEMVVFEWLRRAGTPEFKELSALIR